MGILLFNTESIKLQTVQNYIEAGIASKEDASAIMTNLDRLDLKDLLAVLLESHGFREQKLSGQKFYVDTSYISGN